MDFPNKPDFNVILDRIYLSIVQPTSIIELVYRFKWDDSDWGQCHTSLFLSRLPHGFFGIDDGMLVGMDAELCSALACV